jgi:hypothetical protein
VVADADDRRSSRTTRLYAPRMRGRTRERIDGIAAGSSARRAVRSSVSVEAGRGPCPASEPRSPRY